MKCKNCGAELNNGRCEYCGSVFPEEMRMFTLKIDPGIFKQVDPEIIKQALCGSHVIKDSRMNNERIEVTCLGDSEPHYIEGV